MVYLFSLKLEDSWILQASTVNNLKLKIPNKRLSILFFWILQTLKMISKILLLCFILTLGATLHTSHQQQQESSPNVSVDEVIEGFEALQGQATANSQKLSTISGEDQLTSYLETVIKSEVRDLYMFETSLIPIFSLDPDACANLTESNRSSLVQKVEEAQANVKKLVDNVNQMHDPTLKEDLLRRASLQYMYLDQVKLGLQRQCRQAPTITTTTYFYNLANNNWVYGSEVQPSDLTDLYMQLSDHGTVTTCPSDKPFVTSGGVTCFNCNGSTPIFDLTEQTCISCPGNTTLNTTTHQCACKCDCYVSEAGYCVPRIKVYLNGNNNNLAGLNNQSIQQYVNKIANAQQNPSASEAKCADNQFSLVTSCTTCPEGQFFIVDTMKCGKCPNFNYNTHICNESSSQPTQPAQPTTGTPNAQNSGAISRIIVADPQQIETSGIQCPSNTPFYTGKQPSLCIQCPIYFDWNRKMCASCPVGSTLIDHHCQ